MSGFEVLGAVAGAGQFIEQGSKIVGLVRAICDQVKDAPEEIRQRLERLENFKSIAKRISDTKLFQTTETEKILTRCDGCIKSLSSILEGIRFNSQDTIMKKTWKAVGGLAQQNEILKLFEELDQERGLLTLHLQALSSEAGESVIPTLKAEFSSLKAEIQNSTGSDDSWAKCRQDLFVTDPSDDREALKTAKGKVIAHTCDWVIERSEFAQWQASQGDLLWISGGPGMGKTMLSIYLTECLESTTCNDEDAPKHPMLYFFCDLKDNRRNTAMSILRGIIFQLISQCERLREHIIPTYEIRRGQLFQEGSFETLWKIFTSMVTDAEVGQVTCILDGLDECEPVSLEILLPKMKQLLEHGSKLKILVMSREHPRCLQSSLGQFPRIRLDPDAKEEVNRGLDQYIATRVSALARDRNYPARLAQHVEAVLRERSEGTYLWVSFVIKDLQAMDLGDIEAHLERLPRGLDAYYETMLRHVSPQHQSLVGDILRWCTFAIRPLGLDEISQALNLPTTTRFLSQNEILEEKLSYCGHILTIQEAKHVDKRFEPEIPGPTVGLVHQSAYDFLTRQEATRGPGSWYSLHDTERQHAKLTSLCIRHFQDNFSQPWAKQYLDKNVRWGVRKEVPKFFKYELLACPFSSLQDSRNTSFQRP